MKIHLLFVVCLFISFCFAESAFDYLVYTQVWSPTLCKHVEHCTVQPEEGRFLFHGLWPTEFRDRKSPKDCDLVPLFDDSHREEIQDLVSDMDRYWPSVTSPNRIFWNKQWKKHGSCTDWPRRRYIREILSFYQNDDLFMVLRSHGISPIDESENEYLHSRDDFKLAIRNAYAPIVGNARDLIIGFDCENVQLFQIRICKTSDGRYFRNCTYIGNCPNKFRFVTYSDQQNQSQELRALKKVTKTGSKLPTKAASSSNYKKVEKKESMVEESYYAILDDISADMKNLDVSNQAPPIQRKYHSTSFMEKIQKDINPNMRAILIDWLVELLVPDTLYLTVNYIDRYLSRNAMNRLQLQLLGVASKMIASKIEEICAPQVEEFCYITDNTYFKEEVLQMESTVLNFLKFKVTAPTIKCFLRIFVRAAQGIDEFFQSRHTSLRKVSLGNVNQYVVLMPSVISVSMDQYLQGLFISANDPTSEVQMLGIGHPNDYEQFDLMSLLQRILDDIKRIQEAACLASTILEVFQCSLRELLLHRCTDDAPDVRQRAFTLLGDLARVCEVQLLPNNWFYNVLGDLLLHCRMDDAPDVRLSAFSFIGDLARPHLKKVIEFMLQVYKDTDEEVALESYEEGVCNLA